jgi:dephospho-CoA kinase
MLIALTGGIGSGKTTVAEFWRELGATIIDADELAREIVLPGSPVLQQLVNEFGADLLNLDGTLNRNKLASLIFSDASKRSRVESIMHPAIQQIAARKITQAIGDVVYVIPLLVEGKTSLRFDSVVNIAVPESIRKHRLVAQRSMTIADAESRIRAQATESERAAAADFQLDGNCSLAELRERAEHLYKQLTRAQIR